MADRMDLMARSYDRFASLVVPFYEELQSLLLDQLAAGLAKPRVVVDLGAGSGIFLEKVCSLLPGIQAIWVDRSPGMRVVAEERLHLFRERVLFIETDLLGAWEESLPELPTHIFSMSAIHHLLDEQKEDLYQKCYSLLADAGCFWNADEVRAEDPAEYLRTLREWDEYMTRLINEGRVDGTIAATWAQWRERNLDINAVKHPGDDCHATVAAQLGMLQRAGFSQPAQLWGRGLWGVLGGCKNSQVET